MPLMLTVPNSFVNAPSWTSRVPWTCSFEVPPESKNAPAFCENFPAMFPRKPTLISAPFVAKVVPRWVKLPLMCIWEPSNVVVVGPALISTLGTLNTTPSATEILEVMSAAPNLSV